MHDRPTVTELLATVRGFLEEDLHPALADSRLRFQVLVAANVLAIAERELGMEPALQASATAVAEQRELCNQIRSGIYDAARPMAELLEQLRPPIERKLQVANPRYLAGYVPPPREGQGS